MASTPMDLDHPVGSNGSAALNISRNLAASAPVSNLSDVVSSFRPTKVRLPCAAEKLPIPDGASEADMVESIAATPR